jgi:20S proteasome alpha/beta subunit
MDRAIDVARSSSLGYIAAGPGNIRLNRGGALGGYDGGGESARVIARNLADIAQQSTQLINDSPGPILKSSAVLIGPAGGGGEMEGGDDGRRKIGGGFEIWKVDPNGQLWKVKGGVVAGEGMLAGEALLERELVLCNEDRYRKGNMEMNDSDDDDVVAMSKEEALSISNKVVKMMLREERSSKGNEGVSTSSSAVTEADDETANVETCILLVSRDGRKTTKEEHIVVAVSHSQ